MDEKEKLVGKMCRMWNKRTDACHNVIRECIDYRDGNVPHPYEGDDGVLYDHAEAFKLTVTTDDEIRYTIEVIDDKAVPTLDEGLHETIMTHWWFVPEEDEFGNEMWCRVTSYNRTLGRYSFGKEFYDLDRFLGREYSLHPPQ